MVVYIIKDNNAVCIICMCTVIHVLYTMYCSPYTGYSHGSVGMTQQGRQMSWLAQDDSL